MIGKLDTPFMRVLAVVFGGSLAVQLFAFLRQLVIAAAFGVERGMDLYLLVLAVATVTSISIGVVIENAAVPMLVARRDVGDPRGFTEIANRLLVMSVLLSVAAALTFALAVPLFARFVATGLNGQDRAAMSDLVWWFMPWALIAIPYYALGSLQKAQGQFRRFMAAEILVTLVSLAVIWNWRPGVHAIPLAFGLGYVGGLLLLVPGAGFNFSVRPVLGSSGRGIRRQVARLVATNQIGTLSTIADRFFISQMPSGVISASSYASLVTGQVASLLSFRDAYMVPLSLPDGRSEKLERLIIGLCVVSIPIAAFLWWQASAIVSVLLERGRFDSRAVQLTATMLSFNALTIPISAAMLPMYRTLQILERMRYAAYVLFGNSVILTVTGLLLVIWMDMGVTGYLLSGLAVSYGGAVLVWILVTRAGLVLSIRRIGAYALYSVALSVSAILIGQAYLPDAPPLFSLLGAVALFSIVYGLGALPILKRLTRIVRTVA